MFAAGGASIKYSPRRRARLSILPRPHHCPGLTVATDVVPKEWCAYFRIITLLLDKIGPISVQFVIYRYCFFLSCHEHCPMHEER